MCVMENQIRTKKISVNAAVPVVRVLLDMQKFVLDEESIQQLFKDSLKDPTQEGIIQAVLLYAGSLPKSEQLRIIGVGMKMLNAANRRDVASGREGSAAPGETAEFGFKGSVKRKSLDAPRKDKKQG